MTDSPYSLGFNVQPGDLISWVGRDGVVHTDVYSPQHMQRVHLTRWQRILRVFTPKRWQKPLWVPKPSPIDSAYKATSDILAAVKSITEAKP